MNRDILHSCSTWWMVVIIISIGFGCDPTSPSEKEENNSVVQFNQIVFPEGNWVDLTYSFDHETVNWPTAEPFQLEEVYAGETENGYFYSAYKFSMAEHLGTHMDAPVHFFQSGAAADEILPEQLSGSVSIIDIQSQCKNDRDYLLAVADLEAWEAENGGIPFGNIILIHTGFGQFWPDKKKYMGTDKQGEEGAANLHFPGISPEAASWLIEKRGIKAIGIDTPSIDHGPSTTFESHQVLAASNIPIFENVANVSQVPTSGATIMAMPMKIKGGSGAPLRIFALIP